MKRFTETEKWRDPWFQDLLPVHKLFWLYLCDQCDPAGIWSPNLRHASFAIGMEVIPEEALKAFGERIEILSDTNDWLLVKFIPFQYPNLSPECKPQAKVFEALRKRNLLERYRVGSQILQEEEEDKEEDKEEEKKRKRNRSKAGKGSEVDGDHPTSSSKAFCPPTVEEARAHAVTIGMPADEGGAFIEHFEARGWRFKGGQEMVSWKASMGTWKRNWQRGVFVGKSPPKMRPSALEIQEAGL